MKNIIEEIKIIDKIKNETYSEKLQKAGFAKKDYQIITIDNILLYLEKQAKEYCKNKNVKYLSKMESLELYPNNNSQEFLKNIDYNTSDENFYQIIFQFSYIISSRNNRECFAKWNEQKLINCFLNPPEYVLDSIIKSKKDFNDIRIVTINIEENLVPDQLVVGIRENSNIRYLIDWWDKDIDISEINVK